MESDIYPYNEKCLLVHLNWKAYNFGSAPYLKGCNSNLKFTPGLKNRLKPYLSELFHMYIVEFTKHILKDIGRVSKPTQSE